MCIGALLFFAHVCMCVCLFVLCRGTAVLFSLQSLVQTSIFDTAASDLVLFVEDASYVLLPPPLTCPNLLPQSLSCYRHANSYFA